MRYVSKRLLLILLFILTFSIGLILGYEIRQRNNTVKTSLIEPIKIIPSPTPTIKIDESLSFANKEILLMNKQNNVSYPQSLTFSIKIPEFHPDWVCYSMGYKESGFEAYCNQKECSANKNVMWPNKPSANQRQICNEELANREYSRNLNTLTIKATEYHAKDEITDYSKIIDRNKLKKTPKGFFYEFNKKNKSKYIYLYSATFYSPFELTSREVSFFPDMMVGIFPDSIYGKYTIEATVTGDDIKEDKVINLFEKIIDSVIFIHPDNS